MIVDDDMSVGMSLKEILRTRGHNVKYYEDSNRAIEEFKKDPVEVVLSDLSMPGIDGFRLIDELKQHLPEVDVVVITGHPTADNAVRTMKSGAYDFIKKPFKSEEIDSVLERIKQRRIILNDLNNMRSETTKLTELNRRLEVLNQLKDNFINNISHELRTPLTILTSAVSLLQSDTEGVLSDLQKKVLDTVDKGVKRLENVIESIFDLTFSRNYKKQISEFSLEEVLDEILLQFQDEIVKKGIEIHKKTNAPGKIMFDKKIFSRVFYHLISNAVKFNKKSGKINIDLAVNNDVLEAKIEDTGIGISEDEQATIFERFYQVNGGSTREHGGAGIGLAAAKKHIDFLGGEIVLASKVGEGSLFKFKIPIKG
jgi:signal transduction histidine kinase